MNYTRAQMLYDDGKYYKWNAQADHDNPYYTGGADHTQFNRTEGYEVLYFINRWENHDLTTYQKVEKMIRYDVPSSIRTHKEIAAWIIANWSKV